MNTQLKIALITGGGTGIGKHAALALAREGFVTIVTGRRREPLEQTVREISAEGYKAHAITADVSDPLSVAALFKQIIDHYGRLDVLFNNAGIFPQGKSIEDIDFNDWKKAVDINLNGVFLCTQAAFRMMKDQIPRGGRIINNGSIAAHSPRPNSAAYATTKHAITGLTKATSLDGRKYDIACGQIDIGNAATDMTKNMSVGALQANGEIAIEPTMDTALAAKAIVYMASLPLEANVQFMTVMATKMPLIGRG
jgi:NAD(P)-dependent dehydrogenase (short-subunit alcohol dehydrogenase family)